MVAELQAEILGMQARLQAAEAEIEKNNLDKAKIQEEVDANHQAYLLKIERVDDKLRDIDTAKQQVLDVMGPKFEELRMTAENIIKDAHRRSSKITTIRSAD